MTNSNQDKLFGVAVELPANDPLRAEHLLGNDWTGERWFSTSEERDAAMAAMLEQPGYYRKGDRPSMLVKKVDKPQG